MDRLRILVVDGDEIWRRGLRRLVEDRAGWEISGEATDSRAAIRRATDEFHDVVAIDDSFSVATIEAIKRIRPGAGLVVFGSHERHDAVRRFFKAGVVAFVSKSDPPETIEQAIEAAARNALFLSPGSSELVIEQYLNPSTTAAADLTPSQTLTSRENDVVRLLAEGKATREAARELGISVKTVENHRANARRKLGARSIGDLVRAAIRAGITD